MSVRWNQVKSVQDSKASSILTVDHQMASYSLDTDNGRLELTKRHRFESCFDFDRTDRVAAPWEKLLEGRCIEDAGSPMVLDSKGKDLGDQGSGEEK